MLVGVRVSTYAGLQGLHSLLASDAGCVVLIEEHLIAWHSCAVTIWHQEGHVGACQFVHDMHICHLQSVCKLLVHVHGVYNIGLAEPCCDNKAFWHKWDSVLIERVAGWYLRWLATHVFHNLRKDIVEAATEVGLAVCMGDVCREELHDPQVCGGGRLECKGQQEAASQLPHSLMMVAKQTNLN